jgi:hypothetical protein
MPAKNITQNRKPGKPKHDEIRRNRIKHVVKGHERSFYADAPDLAKILKPFAPQNEMRSRQVDQSDLQPHGGPFTGKFGSESPGVPEIVSESRPDLYKVQMEGRREFISPSVKWRRFTIRSDQIHRLRSMTSILMRS